MTPQDKAKELFDKMYNTDDPMGNYPMCHDTAKQCALIAVNELIDEFCAMDKFIGEQVSHIYPISSYIEYWLETKQEIEKL